MPKEVLPLDKPSTSSAGSSNDITDAVIKSPAAIKYGAFQALSAYGNVCSSDEEPCGSDDCPIAPNNTSFAASEDSDSEICDLVDPFNLTTNVSQKSDGNKIAVDDDVDDDDDSVSTSSDEVVTSSEESDFSGCSEASEAGEEEETCLIPRNEAKTTTRGELTLDDLPPIEDLHISVRPDQCALIGVITTIVDKLVVVQGNENSPPVDLETVLFLDPLKPLGVVFDVFGPVKEPLYCVRFNSSEHIREKDVSVGKDVYFVPKSKHTKFVFVAHLLKLKGSDASWEDNNEPPLECIDYSDDEEERKARKHLKLRQSNVQIKDEVETESNSLSTGSMRTAVRAFSEKRDRRVIKKPKNRNRNRNQNSLIREPAFNIRSSSTFECRTPAQTQLQPTHPQFPQQFHSSNTFPINTSIPPPSVAHNMSMPPTIVANNNALMSSTVTSNLSIPPPVAIPFPGTSLPNMFNTPPPSSPLPFHCTIPPPVSFSPYSNNNLHNSTFPSPFTSPQQIQPPQSTFAFNNSQTPPFPTFPQSFGQNTQNFNQWR